jgi:hypothetical protein
MSLSSIFQNEAQAKQGQSLVIDQWRLQDPRTMHDDSFAILNPVLSIAYGGWFNRIRLWGLVISVPNSTELKTGTSQPKNTSWVDRAFKKPLIAENNTLSLTQTNLQKRLLFHNVSESHTSTSTLTYILTQIPLPHKFIP